MPKPFSFKAGSLIFAQGDNADKVFILQNGKVSLVYEDLKTGDTIRDQLQPGEFFGVKSALGCYPRQENAIATANTNAIAFTIPEFESLAMSNTRIIMKMLKVFSNYLRRVHAQVSSLLRTGDVKPDAGLFAIGEKYLKNRRYAYAKYIFSRYLFHYPTGENAKQAAVNLRAAEVGLSGGSADRIIADAKNAEIEKAASIREKTTYDTEEPEPESAAGPTADSAVVDVTDDPAGEKAYYDAVSLISQQKYKEALEICTQIMAANGNSEWTEKCAYEAGHCLLLLKKFEACIKHYTKFFTQYPENPDIKDAMFYVGQAFEKVGNTGKAAGWYKKIIAMPNEEKDGVVVRAKKALNELERQ